MTFRSNTKAAFAFSALAIGMATISTQASATAQFQGITASQPSSSTTQLRIDFNGKPTMPVAYQESGSNQLILDFNQADLGKLSRNTQIKTGLVEDITALSNGTTARLMVNLNSAATYSFRIDGNQLIADIVDVGNVSPMVAAKPSTPQVMDVKVNPLLVPANAQSSQHRYEGISSVNYLANKAGGGDISIALTNESIPVDVQRQGNKIVIRTTGANIPRHLMRRLKAGGLVAHIDATNQGQNGIVTINMSGDYEYQAYQSGSQLNVAIRPPKLLREPTLEEKVYKGEPLSMEFENVPVRTVLDVLARFTNINIVSSDAVQGEMTLRVINVPWDQVLDIILKSKNLDKRTNGNVIIVGPADALAEQEAKALEAQKKVETLLPLRTEFIRLNYAKAGDVMALISEAKNTGTSSNQNASLLSERGSVSVDSRTNTLVVRDVADSIQNVRNMVEKIDIPVRQVMIEARIVTAKDTFSKDLGVRWGLAMNRGDLQAGGSQTTLWDIRKGGSGQNYGRLGGATIRTGAGAESNNMMVDLGATNPAGRIAFGLLSLSDAVLDLELSAMQADNRGEVISSPKVLTADKQKAKILSGQKIPYETSAASGGTTVSFIDAALLLEVTPNITPDGKISLELNVANGSPVFTPRGMAVAEDSIQTNVILEDGQTIVLGGVYKQTTGNVTNKVPFLGDLPYVGRLFKNEQRQNNKEELLIFVTPKLINDNVSRIN